MLMTFIVQVNNSHPCDIQHIHKESFWVGCKTFMSGFEQKKNKDSHLSQVTCKYYNMIISPKCSINKEYNMDFFQYKTVIKNFYRHYGKHTSR